MIIYIKKIYIQKKNTYILKNNKKYSNSIKIKYKRVKYTEGSVVDLQSL